MKKDEYLGVKVITLNYDEIIEDIKKRMDSGLKIDDYSRESGKSNDSGKR